MPAAKNTKTSKKTERSTSRTTTKKSTTTRKRSANGTARTKKASIEAQENQKVALALRIEGHSYQEIADKMKMAKSSVFEMVDRAMKDNLKTIEDRTEQLRTEEVLRLDAIILHQWPYVKAGDEKAAAVVIRAGERKAKLLGLDMPTKVAPVNPNGDEPYRPKMSSAEADARIQELLKKLDG